MVDIFQVRAVVRSLQSKYIKISVENEWLQGCCSYYLSNNPNTSTENLQAFVFEQWLLADLRDIGECTLPPSITSEKTFIRETDAFALQVDCILNVGESCYAQLQKIRNVSLENLEVTETAKPQSWEPTHRRMLKLTCTDGMRTVYGMEYQTIPALKEPFIPGFKIIVKGPVECRRGVMLLRPNNIQILGGESDTLIVKNAMENVLARALKLEENSSPFEGTTNNVPVDAAETEANRAVPQTTGTMSQTEATRTVPPNPTNIDTFDDDDDIFLCEQLTQVERLYEQETRNANRNQNIQQQQGTATTCSSRNEPYDRNMLNSVEHEFPNMFPSSTTRPFPSNNDINQNSTKRPPIGIACPIISPGNFPNKRPATSPAEADMKTAKASCGNTSVGQNTTQSSSSSFKTFNRIVSEDDNSSSFPLDTLETSLSIAKLKELSNQSNSASICDCNAAFHQLTSKPRIREESWQLTAEIKDETGTLEVIFSDAYLETVFEFSAIEVASQRERVKVNPAIKERVDKILKRGVQKIMSLQGQFRIEISPKNATLPKVIDVLQ